jgi:hypothetical protein
MNTKKVKLQAPPTVTEEQIKEAKKMRFKIWATNNRTAISVGIALGSIVVFGGL